MCDADEMLVAILRAGRELREARAIATAGLPSKERRGVLLAEAANILFDVMMEDPARGPDAMRAVITTTRDRWIQLGHGQRIADLGAVDADPR